MTLKLNKNNLLNIGIIILALIFANNIYKGQRQIVESLKQKGSLELKKNVALGNISHLEKMMNSYGKFFNKDRSLIISTINNIARESDAKIISIKPQKEINFPVYVQYPFDLVIGVNSYHSLGGFFSKLESYSEVFIVDSVQIRPATEVSREGQESKLNVNLRISAISF
jgi:Tfp pilus assembly protein PilO